MKITKFFIAASAAAMVGSILANVPGHKKDDLYKASINDASVQALIDQLADHQSKVVRDSFASVYFSNLHENFGYNTKGTCGVVAMSMLLSFYDTYSGDWFVPDQFEQTTILEEDPNVTYLSRDVESPGVISEPLNQVQNLSDAAYLNYINQHQNDYFHCYLANFCGIDTVEELHGMSANDLTINLEAYIWNHHHYYPQISAWSLQNQLSVSDLLEEDSEFRHVIDQGYPVILNIQSNTIGNHSVVAYDYDANNVYVHTGWKDSNGRALTHVSLAQLGTTLIEGGCYISDNIVLDNYGVRNNYEYLCDYSDNYANLDIQTLRYPQELEFNPDSSRYVTWKTLKDEPHHQLEQNLNVRLKLINHLTNTTEINVNVSNTNSYFINNGIFNSLEDFFGNYDYTIRLEAPVQTLYGTRTYSVEKRFTNHVETSEIVSADYNMTSSYSSTSWSQSTSLGGLNFETRRSNVRKSANRIQFATVRGNKSEAYIEYRFEKPVEALSFDIAFATANDVTDFTRGGCGLLVQSFQNGEFSPAINSRADLFNNCLIRDRISDISAGNTVTINYRFLSPTFMFRIMCQSSASIVLTSGSPRVGKASNKTYVNFELQRLELAFEEGEYLPVSGYEYHEKYRDITSNGYMYALGINESSLANVLPGELTSDDFADYDDDGWMLDEYYDLDVLTEMMEADAAPGGLCQEGYTFEPIGKYERPDEGCYKIALVLATPDQWWTDFRVYRQNSSGAWSYKADENLHSSSVDLYGELILDPEFAVTGNPNDELEYSVPTEDDIRFFQVSRVKGSLDVSDVAQAPNLEPEHPTIPEPPYGGGGSQPKRISINAEGIILQYAKPYVFDHAYEFKKDILRDDIIIITDPSWGGGVGGIGAGSGTHMHANIGGNEEYYTIDHDDNYVFDQDWEFQGGIDNGGIIIQPPFDPGRPGKGY